MKYGALPDVPVSFQEDDNYKASPKIVAMALGVHERV